MKVKHLFAKKYGNSKIALIPRATLTACLCVYRYSAFSQVLLLLSLTQLNVDKLLGN